MHVNKPVLVLAGVEFWEAGTGSALGKGVTALSQYSWSGLDTVNVAITQIQFSWPSSCLNVFPGKLQGTLGQPHPS